MSAKVSRRGLFGLFGGGVAALASQKSVAASPPVSAFRGIADIRAPAFDKNTYEYGAADIYVSDFGGVTLVKWSRA
jgi:hypothetical protein